MNVSTITKRMPLDLLLFRVAASGAYNSSKMPVLAQITDAALFWRALTRGHTRTFVLACQLTYQFILMWCNAETIVGPIKSSAETITQFPRLADDVACVITWDTSGLKHTQLYILVETWVFVGIGDIQDDVVGEDRTGLRSNHNVPRRFQSIRMI